MVNRRGRTILLVLFSLGQGAGCSGYSLGLDDGSLPDAGEAMDGRVEDAGRLPDGGDDAGDGNTGAEDTGNLDLTREHEPNDEFVTANPLATPTETDAVIKTGAVDPPSDVDYFVFNAVAGDSYTIVVEPGTGSPLVPFIAVEDPDAEIRFLNLNSVGATPARLEMHAFRAGPHAIVVGDARNFDGGSAGGSTYTYTLHVTRSTRVVHGLGAIPVASSAAPQSKLTLGGTTAWYSFEVGGAVPRRVAIDLDLSSHASAGGFALVPHMDVFANGGFAPIAGGNRVSIPDLVLPPGDYMLAVRQPDGAASEDQHAFRPRIVAADATASTAVGNTTMGGAHDVGPDAATLTNAALAAGSQSWFALGTLPAGAAVSAATMAPPGAGIFNSVLALVDAGGSVVDSANATNGHERRTFNIPSADDYFIRVTGLDGGAGTFQLAVVRDVCAVGTDTPAVFVNEALADADPATQFVELVNFGTAAANVGGWVVRDSEGIRFRGACDLSMPTTARAAVVHGECGFVGCLSANVDPAAPQSTGASSGRLGLGESGELILLTNSEGTIVDRIVIPATSPGESFARGSGTLCDVEPTNQSVQPHTACTGAIGSTSPGTRANGTPF
jgi:hypothetical protein